MYSKLSPEFIENELPFISDSESNKLSIDLLLHQFIFAVDDNYSTYVDNIFNHLLNLPSASYPDKLININQEHFVLICQAVLEGKTELNAKHSSNANFQAGYRFDMILKILDYILLDELKPFFKFEDVVESLCFKNNYINSDRIKPLFHLNIKSAVL
jgi:hypothetical protein